MFYKEEEDRMTDRCLNYTNECAKSVEFIPKDWVSGTKKLDNSDRDSSKSHFSDSVNLIYKGHSTRNAQNTRIFEKYMSIRQFSYFLSV